MAARANRRGSVEINQLTQWKHQQNLEEIKMLKLSASSPSPSHNSNINSNTNSISSAMQGKLSKLSSRLQKASSTTTPLRYDQASDSLPQAASAAAQKADHFKPPQPNSLSQYPEYGGSLTQRDHNQNQNSVKQSEVDALLKEKQHWLRSIHEDNAKMATLLKDLKLAKENLHKKLQELENEKRLAALSPIASSIETFLEHESDISSAKRSLTVPTGRQGDAADLLRDLLILAGEFRANQSETQEFFYKNVRLAVSDFVQSSVSLEEELADRRAREEEDMSIGEDGHTINSVDQAWKHHVEVLRALASSGPGNIRAAESIAASSASAVIRAAAERTEDLLELHQLAVEKRHQMTLKDEIRALDKENRELKASLAQMRKNNVQLRMRAAADAMMRPTSPSTVLSDGGMGDREAKSIGGDTRDEESAYAAGGNSVISIHSTGALSDQRSQFAADEHTEAAGVASTLPRVASTSMLESAERLPKVVERFLLKELAEHARMVIEVHPLAETLSEGMLLRLMKDLSKEVQGIAAAAFFAFLHHRQGIVELPECLMDGTVQDIDKDVDLNGLPFSAEVTRAVQHVREAVDHVLQVSSVHTELSALATLYLTYLHCRPGEEGTTALGAVTNTDGMSVPSRSSRADGTSSRDGMVSISNSSHRGAPPSVAGSVQSKTQSSSRAVLNMAEAALASPGNTLRGGKLNHSSAAASPLPRYMQAKSRK